MALSFRIHLDQNAAGLLVRRLDEIPRKAPQAMRAALNTTLRFARGRMRRAMVSEIRIKLKDTDRFVKTQPSTTGKDPAKVSIVGSRLRLTEVGAKELKRAGVRYQIRHDGPPKTIRIGFIAKARYDIREHVWRRVGKARKPIIPLFGPSAPQVVEDSVEIHRVIQDDIGAELLKNVDRQSERFLKEVR
jgi:hypothetical protein